MPFQYADVEEEYKKNPDLKKADVQNLREWASKQAHLPPLSELDIILFLQSCRYRNEVAKNAIDNYYTSRTAFPDMFLNKDVNGDEFIKTLNMSMLIVLPNKLPDGCAVVLGRLINTNPDVYNFNMQMKYFDMLITAYLHRYGTVNGFHFVMDMEGSQFGHLTKVSLSQIKATLFFVQEAVPIRLMGVHYIHIASFIDKMMTLMKPFMKKELFDLLHIHSNIESLYKFIPKDCLPIEYGGTGESRNDIHEKLKVFLKESDSFQKEEETKVVDESKRLGKSKHQSVFGTEGTFKKLDLD